MGLWRVKVEKEAGVGLGKGWGSRGAGWDLGQGRLLSTSHSS